MITEDELDRAIAIATRAPLRRNREQLVHWRKTVLGLSQERFALRLRQMGYGTHERTVKRWEAGRRIPVWLAVLRATNPALTLPDEAP